jgi:lysyl-tRNA synthetase class I
MVDEATIRMNIEILKEKLANTTDPKEKKKLEKIIEKQEKWADKFKNMTDKFKQDAQDSTYQAEAIASEDDQYIEQQSDDSNTSAPETNGTDFPIIM